MPTSWTKYKLASISIRHWLIMSRISEQYKLTGSPTKVVRTLKPFFSVLQSSTVSVSTISTSSSISIGKQFRSPEIQACKHSSKLLSCSPLSKGFSRYPGPYPHPAAPSPRMVQIEATTSTETVPTVEASPSTDGTRICARVLQLLHSTISKQPSTVLKQTVGSASGPSWRARAHSPTSTSTNAARNCVRVLWSIL